MSASPTGGVARHPELLGVYCNDHLAAATGGIELVTRMIGRWRGSDYEQPLAQLLDELREERAGLRTTMAALGLPVRQYKQLATWIGEKLTRAVEEATRQAQDAVQRVHALISEISTAASEQSKGVAQVNVMGAQKYAVRVQLDPWLMAARGIPVRLDS